jgi:hypothetical protein
LQLKDKEIDGKTVSADEQLFNLFFANGEKDSLQERYKNTILNILDQTRSRIKLNSSAELLKQ